MTCVIYFLCSVLAEGFFFFGMPQLVYVTLILPAWPKYRVQVFPDFLFCGWTVPFHLKYLNVSASGRLCQIVPCENPENLSTLKKMVKPFVCVSVSILLVLLLALSDSSKYDFAEDSLLHDSFFGDYRWSLRALIYFNDGFCEIKVDHCIYISSLFT